MSPSCWKRVNYRSSVNFLKNKPQENLERWSRAEVQQRDVYCLCSVQDGTYMFGKARVGSTLSLECLPMLPRNGFHCCPFSSFQVRSSSTSSLHAIDGVMSLALCPKTISQVPQHLGYRKGKPLWGLLCPPTNLVRHFSVTLAFTKQTHTISMKFAT